MDTASRSSGPSADPQADDATPCASTGGSLMAAPTGSKDATRKGKGKGLQPQSGGQVDKQRNRNGGEASWKVSVPPTRPWSTSGGSYGRDHFLRGRQDQLRAHLLGPGDRFGAARASRRQPACSWRQSAGSPVEPGRPGQRADRQICEIIGFHRAATSGAASSGFASSCHPGLEPGAMERPGAD